MSRRGLYDETGEVDDENDPLSQEIIHYKNKFIILMYKQYNGHPVQKMNEITKCILKHRTIN